MTIDFYSKKQTIINQHSDYFNSLPKHYKPKSKDDLPERKRAVTEFIDKNLINYKNEDYNSKPAGS